MIATMQIINKLLRTKGKAAISSIIMRSRHNQRRKQKYQRQPYPDENSEPMSFNKIHHCSADYFWRSLYNCSNRASSSKVLAADASSTEHSTAEHFKPLRKAISTASVR